MFWLAAPLLGLVIVRLVNPQLVEVIQRDLGRWGISPTWLTWVLLPTLYVAYVVGLIGWLSRRMETEADLMACGQPGARPRYRPDPDASQSFGDSLMRLAAESRQDPFQRTWLHPSLGERVVFLQRVAGCPALADEFWRRFRRARRLMLAGWAAGVLVLVMI
jgi:hypothetical protein